MCVYLLYSFIYDILSIVGRVFFLDRLIIYRVKGSLKKGRDCILTFFYEWELFKLSGGAFTKGKAREISFNLNGGWIYSCSTTLLKLHKGGINQSPP